MQLTQLQVNDQTAFSTSASDKIHPIAKLSFPMHWAANGWKLDLLLGKIMCSLDADAFVFSPVPDDLLLSELELGLFGQCLLVFDAAFDFHALLFAAFVRLGHAHERLVQVERVLRVELAHSAS